MHCIIPRIRPSRSISILKLHFEKPDGVLGLFCAVIAIGHGPASYCTSTANAPAARARPADITLIPCNCACAHDHIYACYAWIMMLTPLIIIMTVLCTWLLMPLFVIAIGHAIN